MQPAGEHPTDERKEMRAEGQREETWTAERWVCMREVKVEERERNPGSSSSCWGVHGREGLGLCWKGRREGRGEEGMAQWGSECERCQRGGEMISEARQLEECQWL